MTDDLLSAIMRRMGEPSDIINRQLIQEFFGVCGVINLNEIKLDTNNDVFDANNQISGSDSIIGVGSPPKQQCTSRFEQPMFNSNSGPNFIYQ